LIGEMLPAGLRGVKVRLDGHADATTDNTVAVTAAKRRLHPGDTLIGHTLQKTHVKPQFVPLDGRPLDAHKRQRDARLPVLRRVEDPAKQRAVSRVGNDAGAWARTGC
jgi:hypothetical protein